MTTCTKCGTEFEKRPTQAKNHCPSCIRQSGIDWRANNPEKYAAQLAARRKPKVERTPSPKAAVYRRQYLQRQTNSLEIEKMNARRTLRHAVAAGKVVRQPCEVCGEPKVHGHHDDYSKPLDVRWLCPPHHIAIHKGDIQ